MKRPLTPEEKREEKELIYWAVLSIVSFFIFMILILEFLPKPRVDDEIFIGRSILFFVALILGTFVSLMGSRYLANWWVRRRH